MKCQWYVPCACSSYEPYGRRLPTTHFPQRWACWGIFVFIYFWLWLVFALQYFFDEWQPSCPQSRCFSAAEDRHHGSFVEEKAGPLVLLVIPVHAYQKASWWISPTPWKLGVTPECCFDDLLALPFSRAVFVMLVSHRNSHSAYELLT